MKAISLEELKEIRDRHRKELALRMNEAHQIAVTRRYRLYFFRKPEDH